MKNNIDSTESFHSINIQRDQRLTRYCAVGAAGVAAFAGAVTHADAALIFTNYNNQTFTDTVMNDASFTLFAFDIDKNGTTDIQIGQRNGDATGAVGGGAIVVTPTGGTVGIVGSSFSSYNYAARLNAGAVIGPATNFVTLAGSSFTARASLASGAGFTNSQWKSGSPSTGYLGIRFTGVNGTQYAYLHLSVASNTAAVPRQITLIDGAYETTPNTAVTAGAVPEPGSLALLALGGVGLATYRRRLQAQKMDVAA